MPRHEKGVEPSEAGADDEVIDDGKEQQTDFVAETAVETAAELGGVTENDRQERVEQLNLQKRIDVLNGLDHTSED